MKSSSRGSALVDFVLLAVPFVLIPFSVISLSVISYAQNVLQDSAVEGARYAALADQESARGCERSLKLASKAFSGFLELAASCTSFISDGKSVEQVVLTGNLPLFGLITSIPEINAVGRAPSENY
jgi:Flp pilus assembly protein TadG